MFFLILFLKYVIIVFIIYLRLILFFSENCILLIIFGSLVIMVIIKIFIKYCKGKWNCEWYNRIYFVLIKDGSS